MNETRLRWLLDVGIPRPTNGTLDVVHAEDLSRLPGPVGLSEAIALGRILVTRDQEFRRPSALPLDHPGIVVFEGAPVDGQEVERNLEHLEFCLRREGRTLPRESPLAGLRFVLKMDRAILQIGQDGGEREFEQWRKVRLQPASA